jgi:hypothetical protein
MIKKVVQRRKLGESGTDDLAYRLSRPPEERIAAVEELRRQFHGDGPHQMVKTVRVIKRRKLKGETGE